MARPSRAKRAGGRWDAEHKGRRGNLPPLVFAAPDQIGHRAVCLDSPAEFMPGLRAEMWQINRRHRIGGQQTTKKPLESGCKGELPPTLEKTKRTLSLQLAAS